MAVGQHRVVLYVPDSARGPQDVLARKLAESARTLELEVEQAADMSWRHGLGIIAGGPRRYGGTNELLMAYKPCLVVECQPFGGHGAAIRVNGTQWLPDEDMPDGRARRIGLVDDQPPKRGSTILVVGQHAELDRWTQNALGAIAQHTSREIVWRPHPHEPTPAPLEAKRTSTASMWQDLRDAWAVVTFHSAVGLAALRWLRPVYCSPTASYASLRQASSDLDVDKWTPPDVDAVRRLLARVAWSWWSLDEIASGEALRWYLERPEIA